jgi:hypothetical protein
MPRVVVCMHVVYVRTWPLLAIVYTRVFARNGTCILVATTSHTLPRTLQSRQSDPRTCMQTFHLGTIHLDSAPWHTQPQHTSRYIRHHLVDIRDVVSPLKVGRSSCETPPHYPCVSLLTKMASPSGSKATGDATGGAHVPHDALSTWDRTVLGRDEALSRPNRIHLGRSLTQHILFKQSCNHRLHRGSLLTQPILYMQSCNHYLKSRH